CEEIDDLLPWYATGECAPDSRSLVERHLAHCPRCRQGYAEMERLSALLDWQHRADESLLRLKGRLREVRRRRAVLPIVRRFAAAAALLLVTIGLTAWPSPTHEEEPSITVALVAGGEEAVPGPRAKALPAREELATTMQRVDLALEVKNQGDRVISLD